MKIPNFLFELWLLLRTTGVGVAGISITMLVQDKICLNQYNQTVSYCLNISKIATSIADQTVKDHILADSAKFSNYKNLIECAPMVLWSLFVGSFLDNYAGATRLMMLLSIFGDFLSIALYGVNIYFFDLNSNYVLLSSSIFWFTGGMATFFTVTFRYIVLTTTEQIRPFKFMMFQLCAVAGLALGTYLGGQLLVTNSRGDHDPAPRTYYRNFVVFFGLDLIALAVTFGLKSGNAAVGNNNLINDDDNDEGDEIGEEIVYQEFDDKRSQPDASLSNENLIQNRSNKNVLRILFNLDNIRQTIVSFTKPRARHVRLRAQILFVILLSFTLLFSGGQSVMFQFTEKVYHWDSKTYTTFSSISTLVSTLFLSFGTGLFVKWLAFEDVTLLMIALISTFANQLVMGIFLAPSAYFVALLIGSLGGFGSLAIRNKISKLFPQDEVGKIFGLASTIEATLPFFGSLIYTYLFSASIATYPGAIFLFGATVLVLSLGLLVFEELYCSVAEGENDL